MNAMGNDRRELVRAVYEQHAAHARHLESQRLLYTLLYTILATAILAVWGIRPFWSSGWPLMVLLAVFSLFGFIFCLEIQRMLKTYFASVALILARYSLDHYLPGGPKQIRLESPGLDILFPAFYLAGLAISLYILFWKLFDMAWLSIILIVIVFIAGMIIVWRNRYAAPLAGSGDQ